MGMCGDNGWPGITLWRCGCELNRLFTNCLWRSLHHPRRSQLMQVYISFMFDLYWEFFAKVESRLVLCVLCIAIVRCRCCKSRSINAFILQQMNLEIVNDVIKFLSIYGAMIGFIGNVLKLSFDVCFRLSENLFMYSKANGRAWVHARMYVHCWCISRLIWRHNPQSHVFVYMYF